MLVYLVGFLPTTIVLQLYGLENGLRISAGLNGLGAVLRWFSTLGVHSFPVAIIGQIICAGSQVINFSCVGSLSRKYFASSGSRVVGIIWALTYTGVAFGLWLPPMMVDSGGSGLMGFWLFLAIASIASTISMFLALRATASIPINTNVTPVDIQPNNTTQDQKLTNELKGDSNPVSGASSADALSTKDRHVGTTVLSTWGQEIEYVLGDKKLLFTFCSFGLLMGSNYAVATELQSIFGEVLDDGEIGTLGLLMVLAGVVGVIGSGALIEAYPKLKSNDPNNQDQNNNTNSTTGSSWCPSSVVASSSLSLISASTLTIVTIGVTIKSSTFIFTIMILYGGAVTALNSTILERSVALSGSHNVSEFTLNSVMMASVQFFGFIMTLITGRIVAPDDNRNYQDLGPVYGSVFFLASCAWLGTLLITWSAHVRRGTGSQRRRLSGLQSLLSNAEVMCADEIATQAQIRVSVGEDSAGKHAGQKGSSGGYDKLRTVDAEDAFGRIDLVNETAPSMEAGDEVTVHPPDEIE